MTTCTVHSKIQSWYKHMRPPCVSMSTRPLAHGPGISFSWDAGQSPGSGLGMLQPRVSRGTWWPCPLHRSQVGLTGPGKQTRTDLHVARHLSYWGGVEWGGAEEPSMGLLSLGSPCPQIIAPESSFPGRGQAMQPLSPHPA